MFSVLIVDDQPAVARAIARVIASHDAEVQVASSLDEARKAVFHQSPDVAVMGLEGGDGLSLLVELMSLDTAPEVIVHAESPSSPAARWAAAHNLQEVFEKPAEPKVLLDWTLRLLRRRRGEPESVRLPGMEAGLGRIIGHAPAIAAIREQILRVAEFPTMSVLVCGETGTGKELIARAIHELSCPDAPFVSVNCAAIPESLFESEVFGHSPGAFTGAQGRRTGLLEEATGGTFFLDEVGELPAAMQPKLLRALETRRFRPVGANREQPLAARIISATNRTLTQARETFRPDLYYRLAGFSIDSPPLRDRAEDLSILAELFLRAFCRLHGRPMMSLTSEAVQALRKHRWPGNVRELRGVIESAAISARENRIEVDQIREALSSRGARLSSLPAPGEAVPQTWSSESHAARFLAPPSPGAFELERLGKPSGATRSPFSPVDETPPQTIREGQPARTSPSGEEASSNDEAAPSTSWMEGAPPSSGTALVGKRGLFETLPELEEFVISDVFRECQGNLSMAARTLGIPRSTLRDRLKKYGIELPANTRHKSS